MLQRPLVIIGILGSTLDSGRKVRRQERWRPSVACVLQPELEVDRFEMLYHRGNEDLRDQVTSDMQEIDSELAVRHYELDVDDPWDFETMYDALYGFCQNYNFKIDKEDYLIHITTGTHVAQICLFMLAESRYLPGRLLQTQPKIRIDPGPDRARGLHRIIDLDLSKYDRLAARFSGEQQAGIDLLTDGIPTNDTAFAKMLARIEHVAQITTAPILITGPTGSGKTRLARRIFQLKKSKHLIDGAFIEVNCATLRGDAAMSTLFGHVKGAFTGASTNRSGLLQEADGGVLFLDEIGELGLDEQAMLLRAIEDKVFRPVGSDKNHLSDFQLVAGTNRDLRKQVAAGTFREDLLARIDLWHFPLPGLADRRDDIEPNIIYEVERFAREKGQNVEFIRNAWRQYLSFAVKEAAWPGNFRDLAGSVERMCTLAGDGRITASLVKEEIERLTMTAAPSPVSAHDDLVTQALGTEAAARLDRFHRVQLADVLAVCVEQDSLAAAGRALFSESRKALSKTNDGDRLAKYLMKYRIRWRDVRNNSFNRGGK